MRQPEVYNFGGAAVELHETCIRKQLPRMDVQIK